MSVTMRRAFSYDWRMWSLPEIDEALREAGFKGVDVYSEGWDAKLRTHDRRRAKQRWLDNDDCWIAYVVGVR